MKEQGNPCCQPQRFLVGVVCLEGDETNESKRGEEDEDDDDTFMMIR